MTVIDGTLAAVNVMTGHRWNGKMDTFKGIGIPLTDADLDVLFPISGGNYYTVSHSFAANFFNNYRVTVEEFEVSRCSCCDGTGLEPSLYGNKTYSDESCTMCDGEGVVEI